MPYIEVVWRNAMLSVICLKELDIIVRFLQIYLSSQLAGIKMCFVCKIWFFTPQSTIFCSHAGTGPA